ncbi:hypothetical protein NKH18_49675 [Streptomyces sp. M10(2022)]
MSAEPEPSPTSFSPSPGARMVRWALTRRHTATSQLLRGICYGTGTALAGAVSLWLQNRLMP